MLSTKYRLRLQAICEKIAGGEEVSLTDMVWANKLAKANHSAQEIMRAARRKAFSNEEEGGLGDFLQGWDWVTRIHPHTRHGLMVLTK